MLNRKGLKEKTPILRSGGQATIMMGEDGPRLTRVESEYRFAFELQNAARVMAKHAKQTKEHEHYELIAFVTGAITLAYSSLEAALNEFVHLNALSSDSAISEEKKEAIRVIGTEELVPQRRAHLLQLYNMMLRILGKEQFPEGKAPYQAANLVRTLRNLLIHPIPGRVVTYVADEDTDLSSQQLVVKKLRSHLKLEVDATFPWDVLTSQCASWAVRSCEKFLHEFVVRSDVDPGFLTER